MAWDVALSAEVEGGDDLEAIIADWEGGSAGRAMIGHGGTRCIIVGDRRSG